jgi:peptidoglycan/xylan/chitin deacetylase (PgdA/CDA1 family)
MSPLPLTTVSSSQVALPTASATATAINASTVGQTALPTPVVASPTAVSLIYLQALQGQQWSSMWQLLHPLARRQWTNEQAFAAFLQRKFAPDGTSTIASVNVTISAALSGWNDVRFTAQPLAAVQVAATVMLTQQAPYAMPPSDLSDRQPMVLVQDAGQWRVVDVQGPVLAPSHPVVRRVRVPIMMYHHVAPAPQRTPQMGDYDYRLAVDLTVTPAAFAAQLDWLVAHGYQTITLQQVMAALYDGLALPPKPIVLSFDDGYQDNADYAGPLLLQRHMVGVFNIVTGLVANTSGTLRYMTWPEIAGLSHEGMQIESHTVFHRDLGVLSALQVQTELVDSRQMIAQHLGQAPQFICYPSGEPFRSGTVAAQRAIAHFAQQDGYVGGLLDPRVAGAVQSSSTPEQLTRIRVAGQETLGQFTSSILDQPGP